MKLKYRILAVIFPLVLILDQLAKYTIVSTLNFGDRIPVIDGFFDIVYFTNTGAAFGMFAGVGDGFRVPFFYIMAAVAVVLLVFFYRSLGANEKLVPLALSLIFGGIAGNILDRIMRGSVVDFLSFHIGDKALDISLFGWSRHVALEWPAFNVADSAITISMFLLLYSALKKRGLSPNGD